MIDESLTPRKPKNLVAAKQSCIVIPNSAIANCSTAKHAQWHFDLLLKNVTNNVWNVRVAILEALRSFVLSLDSATADNQPGVL